MTRHLRSCVVALALVTIAAAACTSAPSGSPSTPASPSSTAPAPASPAAANPIVVDTDLAADDILAIMVLLRQPGVDVRAITVSGTGEVRCPAGLRNTRRLVAAFGRSDIAVACGRENPGPNGRWFPSAWRDGADGFYGVELPEVDGESSRDGEDAATLLARLAGEARAAGTPLTVVPIGPWTNLADALAADPAFATNLAGIHTMGGTIDAPGNIDIETTLPSDLVEWNFGVDPDALAAVLATKVPVTMVGLDATDDVPVPPDIATVLGEDTAAAGADIAHEMYLRNPWLHEGSSFWDTLAAVLLTDPSIATWEDVTVRAETSGRSAGRTARDPGGRVVHAAMSADRERFMAALLAGLRTGAPRAGGRPISGALTATWDGTECTLTATPTTAGEAVVTFDNQAPADASLGIARVSPPHTWEDAIAFVRSADPADPNVVQPAWIVPVDNTPGAAPGSTGTSVARFDPGSYAFACISGTWPKVEFADPGGFEVGG